jgi:hypothetical protein
MADLGVVASFGLMRADCSSRVNSKEQIDLSIYARPFRIHAPKIEMMNSAMEESEVLFLVAIGYWSYGFGKSEGYSEVVDSLHWVASDSTAKNWQ